MPRSSMPWKSRLNRSLDDASEDGQSTTGDSEKKRDPIPPTRFQRMGTRAFAAISAKPQSKRPPRCSVWS